MGGHAKGRERYPRGLGESEYTGVGFGIGMHHRLGIPPPSLEMEGGEGYASWEIYPPLSTDT